MLDKNQFKKVLSQYPTGVSVVTTANEDGMFGLTVNSFASVSLEPALVLWSIDKSTFSLEAFLNSEGFAISILNEHQQDISNLFASHGVSDKFESVDYELQNNMPVIKNAKGILLCKTENIIEAGDHHIIVGKVDVAVQPNDDEAILALAYYRSGYKNIS